MKRILYTALCSLLFLNACAVRTTLDSDLTYFDDYPEVIDILDYLEVSEEDCRYVSKEKDHFIVCFPEDESAVLNDYIHDMEKNGFKADNYSATVWDTTVLKKGPYEIQIASINQQYIDEWISCREDSVRYQTIQDQDFDSISIIVYELTLAEQ